jgi:hypothetical protein
MGNETKLPADILGLPLQVRAFLALRAAVKKVLEEHARNDEPVYIWRDGKVAEVPACELLENYPELDELDLKKLTS